MKELLFYCIRRSFESSAGETVLSSRSSSCTCPDRSQQFYSTTQTSREFDQRSRNKLPTGSFQKPQEKFHRAALPWTLGADGLSPAECPYISTGLYSVVVRRIAICCGTGNFTAIPGHVSNPPDWRQPH